jgi:hypothetical protein
MLEADDGPQMTLSSPLKLWQVPLKEPGLSLFS